MLLFDTELLKSPPCSFLDLLCQALLKELASLSFKLSTLYWIFEWLSFVKFFVFQYPVWNLELQCLIIVVLAEIPLFHPEVFDFILPSRIASFTSYHITNNYNQMT